MRAAGLYKADALTFLHLVPSRYAVQLQYKKPVIDAVSRETALIPTFSKAAEVRDGTAAGVMLEVSKLLDLFLVEYLRVNESAGEQADPSKGVVGDDAVSSPRAHVEEKAAASAKDRQGTERTGSKGGMRRGHMWPDLGGDVPEPKVNRFGGGVTAPRVLSKVAPEYSEEARNAKLEGTVRLAIEVWEDGKAHNILVLGTLGMGLDEKAIEAVVQWKFKLGTKDGNPVRVAAEVHVNFKLVVRPRSH